MVVGGMCRTSGQIERWTRPRVVLEGVEALRHITAEQY
jgi:hypothetical protein